MSDGRRLVAVLQAAEGRTVQCELRELREHERGKLCELCEGITDESHAATWGFFVDGKIGALACKSAATVMRILLPRNH